MSGMRGSMLLERDEGEWEGFMPDIMKKSRLGRYMPFQPSGSASFATEDVSPSDQIFEKERKAFFEIKKQLIDDPQYIGKYIAIVNGEVAGVGDDRIKLAREVYTKKGYVTMYIGEVKQEETVAEEPSFEVL